MNIDFINVNAILTIIQPANESKFSMGQTDYKFKCYQLINDFLHSYLILIK